MKKHIYFISIVILIASIVLMSFPISIVSSHKPDFNSDIIYKYHSYVDFYNIGSSANYFPLLIFITTLITIILLILKVINNINTKYVKISLSIILLFTFCNCVLFKQLSYIVLMIALIHTLVFTVIFLLTQNEKEIV